MTQNPFQQGPPAGDPFTDPGSAAGGTYPGVHQLVNRLLLIKPTKLDRQVPSRFPNQQPSDQITADVVFLDGPAIPAKIDGNTQQATPFADGPITPGTEMKAFFISGKVLVRQLEDAVPSGMVLGRLVIGTPGNQGQPPKKLEDPTEADKQAARSYLAWKASQPAPQQTGPAPFAQPGPAQQQVPQGYGPPPAQNYGQQAPGGAQFPGQVSPQEFQQGYGQPPQGAPYNVQQAAAGGDPWATGPAPAPPQQAPPVDPWGQQQAAPQTPPPGWGG